MGSRRQARILAFQTLFSHEMNPRTPEDLLGLTWLDEVEHKDLEPDVLFFTRLLISGTLENLEAIDALITKNLKNWDFKRISKVDLAILRISVYQLLYLKDIPANVVLDEAIDIAKKFSSDEAYRFVNGVLDGIKREKGL